LIRKNKIQMIKSFIYLFLIIADIYAMSIWDQRFRNQNKLPENEFKNILNKFKLDQLREMGIRLKEFELKMQQQEEERRRTLFDQERRTKQEEDDLKRQRLLQAHFGGSSLMKDFLPNRYI
jgi:hypothetical protein